MTVAKIDSSRLSVLKRGDLIFRWTARLCAWFVLALLGAILITLAVKAWPALSTYGLAFLTTQRWAPNASPEPILGGLAPLYGTLISSLFAMMIALPIGLGIAIFLTELCPTKLRQPISAAIELLAGVPSIIYGMWGFFVLCPFLANHIEPALIEFFADVPILCDLFKGPANNLSLFNASMVLAIMVLPFVAAVSRDVLLTAPAVLKEAAYGLGCTRWEVIRSIVIPYARVGLVGAVMLALGRALGETMAVTFVIGNAFKISSSIFAPATTISAAIASEFAESSGLHQSALALLGLLLFILTFFVLALARVMLARLNKFAGN